MALQADDPIGKRLDRLELENRQLRWAAVVLLTGCLAAVSVAGKFGKGGREIQAERFVLKDKEGRIRAVMGPGSEGGPELALMDLQGRKLATLGATVEDTPKFVLLDQGNERVSMSTARDGSAVLTFHNQKLGAWSGLSLLPDGAMNLDFFGPTRSLQLGVSPAGAANLAFADSRGNPIGGLGIRADGPADTLVVDHDGSVLFPIRPKGSAEPVPIPHEINKPQSMPFREIVAQHARDAEEAARSRVP